MKRAPYVLIVSLALICCITAASQEPPQRPPASDFNIEIRSPAGLRRIDSVPGAGVHSGYFETDQLRRIAGWKPSAAAVAGAAALLVGYWTEKDGVQVEVTVFLGQAIRSPRPADLDKLKRVKVATCFLRENETITVRETEEFGIESLSFKVVRAQPWSIGPPEIVNSTKALYVTSIAEARPDYAVSVRNVSTKCITALSWYGRENGKTGGGSGLSGACVVPAGKVFEIHQRFALLEAKEMEDSQPQLPAKREIVIAAILFDDGTFEGEADKAAEMAARRTGRGIQSSRVLQLLQNTAVDTAEDKSLVLSSFKQNISSLGEDVEPAIVVELLSHFADASEDMRQRRITEEVRNGLRSVKSNVLREIEVLTFKLEHSPEPVDFSAWKKRMTRTLESASVSY